MQGFPIDISLLYRIATVPAFKVFTLQIWREACWQLLINDIDVKIVCLCHYK
jgi:hypothetical protein